MQNDNLDNNFEDDEQEFEDDEQEFDFEDEDDEQEFDFVDEEQFDFDFEDDEQEQELDIEDDEQEQELDIEDDELTEEISSEYSLEEDNISFEDFEEEFEILPEYIDNPELKSKEIDIDSEIDIGTKETLFEETEDNSDIYNLYKVSDFVLQYLSLKPKVFENVSNELIFDFLKTLKNNCPAEINTAKDLSKNMSLRPILIEDFEDSKHFQKLFSFLAWISSISKIIMVQDSYVDSRETLFKNINKAEEIKENIEELLKNKRNIISLNNDISILNKKINNLKKSFKTLHLTIPITGKDHD